MSKRSCSPASFGGSSLDLSEGSSASEMDSDNSRDVNLNSKKFTDCNLFGAEIENNNKNNNNNNNINNNNINNNNNNNNSVNNNNNKNDEYDLNFTSAIEDLNEKYNLRSDDNERTEVQSEKPGLNAGSNSELENSINLSEALKNSMMISSTPKPGPAESQALSSVFTISMDGPPTESGSEGQTYLVAQTALNQSASLTNEEIGKKFQDLSFAFKTDSMTIQERLQLMKRRRDQAETNIENELGIIRAKLKTLQYLGLNSECINLMSDLKKQLDFVLKATVQLSSSAESYGYAQHEEKLLELIAYMLQHVENMESSKSDSSRAADKLKAESPRSSTSVFLESARDDDKILRRRSVAAVTLQGTGRRRASIATLPRIGNSMENGSNGKGSQWITPNRPSVGAAKKLSFCQASPRTHFSSLPTSDDTRRDSIGARHRKESRTSEVPMTNIDESPEQRPSVDSESTKEPIDSETNVEVSDSSLHLKQLFESIEEVRRSSGSQEHVTAVYCLRRIVEWNKLLLSSARFRWPENVLHYAPFYITWYIVFILALVFVGGLFTGINGCHTYSCLKYSVLWFAAPAFFSLARRFYRFLLPLFLSLVFALTLFYFWLTKILLPQLTNEEVDSLLTTFGFEIRYLNGPPPV